MKTNTERQAEFRARMRSDGYMLKQIWVKPRQWERQKKYLNRTGAVA